MSLVSLTNTYDTIGGRTAVAEILSDAQASRFVIQDFRPLVQSVEWKLGQAYLDRGSKAFAGDGHIPFAVNNDGNLSVDAAEVLFDNLPAAEDHRPLEPEIRVLELGPGLGLFARYFLDAFRDLCRERRKDYYDRLTYVAGDRSGEIQRGRESFPGMITLETTPVPFAGPGNIDAKVGIAAVIEEEVDWFLEWWSTW